MSSLGTNYTINPDVYDDEIIESLALLFTVFLFGAVLPICAAIIQFVTNLVKIGLPYTVVVFMLGMLMGLAEQQKIKVGPHLLLNTFMPILIFEGAFAMDVFVLRKVFWQALFMAGPGLVVITGLTALVAQPLFKNKDWDWKESLLFGSILSATDPVAVVALLKELGASPFLSLFIEGESLMNDGTAMVAFTVLYNVITGDASLTAEYVIVGGFMRFAVGGPLFGYFMSRCCLLWLNKTFNDPLSEIAATFTAAFLTFFVSENFIHVSGVLALVVLGVVLSNNRTSISPEVETFLHSFWEALAYLANTLIFFLVGTIVMQLIAGKKSNPWDFVLIFVIYMSVNSIRAMVIILFSPLLKRMGYQLPWQFTIVASWSGLRGAVGLALALMVYETSDDKIPKDTVSHRVFLHLCGIVFLTLVINATTISKILDLLGMSNISDARRAAMATSLSVLAEIKHKTMCVWMTDRFLSDVDWTLVDELCSLHEPWDLTQDEDEEKKLRVWAVCPQCDEDVPYQPTMKEMQEMRREAILRLLKAQKLSYWRQFEHGMLSVVAVRTLQELCELAADIKGHFLDVGVIKDTWKTSALTKMVEWVRKQDLSKSQEPGYLSMVFHVRSIQSHTGRRCTCCEKRPRSLKELLTSRWFVVTVAVVLYLTLDATSSAAHVILFMQDNRLSRIFGFLSVGLWALMVIYSILRLAVLRKVYIHTTWFWLSCLIFLSGIVDLVVDEYIHNRDKMNFSKNQAQMALFILLGIKLIRQVHALEALVPVIIMVLENQEVQRLSDGYDVGRGFVMGEEEIRGRIDHMADRKDIIDELRTHCDTSKMDILKELGLLQKDNPEVAMGVKTRQAIRSVLNNIRDEIHMLLQDGILEEAEGSDLAGMVESKMKKLLTAPPKVPLPSTEKILQNVPWIADNEDLVRFIQSRAKFENYEYGDIIMRQDEPTTGVSIILSGLVKLELSIPVTMDSADGEPKYITRVLDFLTAGNVLGELGVLTGKPRSATVKCETGIQLLGISLDDIQDAFEKFQHMQPPLKYRLWRLSAIRLCTGIFLDQPSFQGMTKEKLRVRLENGYVEEIQQTPSTFPIYFHIGELVLLHGEAVDGYTHEKYNGPCYIPQHVQLLSFETHQSPNPALFILPTENAPVICRPSLSVPEGPPTLDDITRSNNPAMSNFTGTTGGLTASSVVMSSGTHGMYKRTALHKIREKMNDKRGSIQQAIRRGSAYPPRHFRKANASRSASITPLGDPGMNTENPYELNIKDSFSLTDQLPTVYSDTNSMPKKKEEFSGMQCHSVSDPTMVPAPTMIPAPAALASSGKASKNSDGGTDRGQPRVPFSMLRPSPYPVLSSHHDPEAPDPTMHLRTQYSLPSVPYRGMSLDSLKHPHKVHPMDFYVEVPETSDRRGRAAEDSPHGSYRFPGTHDAAAEKKSAFKHSKHGKGGQHLSQKSRKKTKGGSLDSPRNGQEEGKGARTLPSDHSSITIDQPQKAAPGEAVDSADPQGRGPGPSTEQAGTVSSVDCAPDDQDQDQSNDLPPIDSDTIYAYYQKKLSMIAEKLSFDGVLEDTSTKVTPAKRAILEKASVPPDHSQSLELLNMPKKSTDSFHSSPADLSSNSKASAPSSQKGQPQSAVQTKVGISAPEPKDPHRTAAGPTTSDVDLPAQARDTTGHTDQGGSHQDEKPHPPKQSQPTKDSQSQPPKDSQSQPKKDSQSQPKKDFQSQTDTKDQTDASTSMKGATVRTEPDKQPRAHPRETAAQTDR